MLLFLTLVLVTPYLVLTVAGRLFPSVRVASATRGKVSLTAFFLVTASGHFMSTAAMAEMLPPIVPLRAEIIYVTGVLQVLAAIGIWIPRLTRLAGFLLVVMLLGILPSNVYSAFARVPFGGHDAGPVYLLVRLPFQFLVIAWAYWATGQRWLRRNHRPGHGSTHFRLPDGIRSREFGRRHPFLPVRGEEWATKRPEASRK